MSYTCNGTTCLLNLNFVITPPGEGSGVLRSACLSVCVCLSVRKHISGTAGPIFTKFCVQIPCDCGSVLLWRRCDTLCTSGFMDVVTFGHNGPYGETWRLYHEAITVSSVARPGRSLMSMNDLFCSWPTDGRMTYTVSSETLNLTVLLIIWPCDLEL